MKTRLSIPVAIFVLGAGLTWHPPGVLSAQLEGALGLGVALAALACLCAPGGVPARVSTWVFAAVGVVVGARLGESGLTCAVLGGAAALGLVLATRPGPRVHEALCGAVALALFDVIRWAPESAGVWYSADGLVKAVTGWASRPFGGARLGLRYSGAEFALALAVGDVVVGVCRGRVRVVGASVRLLVTMCASLALTYGLLLSGVALHETVRWCASGAVVAAAAMAGIHGREDALEADSARPPSARLGWGAACVLALAAVLNSSAPVQDADRPPTRVWCIREGLQTWNDLRHGEYGSWSGGMFGGLAESMSLAGAELHRVGADEFLRSDVSPSDMVWFLNFNGEPAPELRDRLHDLTRRGLVWVVFGDHTDVAGLMRGSNRLLESTGIAYRFDSAKTLESDGRMFGRIGAPFADALDAAASMPYGVGASLSLSGGARPLVFGRYAFSDAGSRANYPGALLGNYRIDAGEEVGDVVVAAVSEIGEGRVVVFGDTTPIQQSALFTSTRSFLRAFVGSRGAFDRPWTGVLAVASLAACAWFLGTRSPLRLPRFRCMFAAAPLAATAMVVHFVSLRPGRLSATSADVRSSVVRVIQVHPVDTSPGTPEWRQTWSVASSARRAGLFPIACYGTDEIEPGTDRFVLVALPLKRIADQERLVEFVGRGGMLLFIGGPRHARALDRVLAAAGARIEARPLGRFPRRTVNRAGVESPVFTSSFELTVDQATADAWTPLLTEDAITVAARRRLGLGYVVVIADEALPYGNNVEGRKSWHLGNIAFLQRTWTGQEPR